VPDFVDALIESWAESWPELDVTPVAVATRLGRVRDHFEGETAAAYGAFGLSATSFVMLATLTRLRGATEARVGEELGLTAGTIAMRIDRLEADGLVARQDGLVDLTERGRELAAKAIPAHVDNLARLLSPLSADEQAALAALLRKLLTSLEG
jgi:DNA-binding MarR family transcriptional regulator